jgi:hypothetical protein
LLLLYTNTPILQQTALVGIRNGILYPQRMKRHKHAKLLETIVHHIQKVELFISVKLKLMLASQELRALMP